MPIPKSTEPNLYSNELVGEQSENETTIKQITDFLYNIPFYTGLKIKKILLSLKKHSVNGIRATLLYILKALLFVFKAVIIFFFSTYSYFAHPIKQAHKECKSIKTIAEKKKNKSFGFRLRYGLVSFANYLVAVVKLLGRSCSIAVPALAIIGFMMTMNYFNNMSFAVLTQNNGQVLGYIDNTQVYQEAEKIMQSRIVLANDQQKPIYTKPSYQLVVLNGNEEIIDADSLCDGIIMSSGEVIQKATGFYIDGVLQGATSDEKTLSLAINEKLDRYRSGDSSETVDFVNDVQMVEGLYPVYTVVDDVQELTGLIDSEVSGEKLYTVAPGDTPLGIAMKNEISFDELEKLNPNITKSLLPGDEVRIANSVPLMQVKVVRTETEQKVLAHKTEYVDNDTMYVGNQTLITEGKDGMVSETSSVTYVDGIIVEKEVVETKVLSAAVSEKYEQGTKLPVSNRSTSATSSSSKTATTFGSGSMQWPVGGGYISCHYMGYAGHTGMDIASKHGTPIYAADSGVVVMVNYGRTGYGFQIMVSHGNGMSTLYAHNSEILVSVGQSVQKGQLIAKMGSTGRSSGNHLHFEVRVNGSPVNPAGYIGYGYR